MPFVQFAQAAARRRVQFNGRLGSIAKRDLGNALAQDPAFALPDDAAPLPDDNPIDDQARAIEPRIRRGVIQFLGFVLASFDLGGVAGALKRQDTAAAITAAGLDNLVDKAGPLAQAVQDAFQDAGQALIGTLSTALADAAKGKPADAVLTVPPADLAADYPHPIPTVALPAVPPGLPPTVPVGPAAAVPVPSIPLVGGTGGLPPVPPEPPFGGAGAVPPSLEPAIAVRFNSLDPNAVAYLQANEMRLIREVTDETRETIRGLVEQGFSAGVNPNDFARQIREVIGLTKWQAGRVQSFRTALTNWHLPDATDDPLSRQLRDRRHDPTVRNARKTGQPLNPKQVDDMVDKYRKRWLAYRARTIARTESIRTANAAAQSSWQQLADKGIFAQEVMRRFWLVALDDRVCPECRAVPVMNPNGVAMNEPFQTPFGPILLAPLHPNCRCYFVVRIVKAATVHAKRAA